MARLARAFFRSSVAFFSAADFLGWLDTSDLGWKRRVRKLSLGFAVRVGTAARLATGARFGTAFLTGTAFFATGARFGTAFLTGTAFFTTRFAMTFLSGHENWSPAIVVWNVDIGTQFDQKTQDVSMTLK